MEKCIAISNDTITKFYHKWDYLPYTDVCMALHTQCFPSVCENLLLTSADILTELGRLESYIAAGSAI